VTAIATATDLADAGRFRVRRWQGSAAELHALDWPDPLVPTVWRLEVDRPTLVLGSTQRVADVDPSLLERLGVALATRRSGGGAVLVEPGNGVWIDVLVPRHDPVWVDDVGRSFDWLGRAWVEALATLGLEAQVHAGAPDRGSLAATVCFAGLGSGEVTVGGAKAVGLSQRRTRAGARLQCTCYRRWHPEPLRALGVELDQLPAVAGVDRDPDQVADALAEALARPLSRRG
jgi:lipoate---protein ligase